MVVLLVLVSVALVLLELVSALASVGIGGRCPGKAAPGGASKNQRRRSGDGKKEGRHGRDAQQNQLGIAHTTSIFTLPHDRYTAFIPATASQPRVSTPHGGHTNQAGAEGGG